MKHEGVITLNIVWLAPELPYPANTGGRILVYNRIKQLSALGNIVYLISIVDDDTEVDYKELNKICKEVTIVSRSHYKARNLLKSFKEPYCAASRTYKSITSKIEQYIVAGNCDIVFCELPQMALNIIGKLDNKDVKYILSLQNIESESMMSLAAGINNKLKRKIYKFESKRLRLLENRIAAINCFDAICFVSDKDMETFKERYPKYRGQTFLSPIGSDRHMHKKCGNIKITNKKNIVFVGKMNYPPNVEGVIWLAKKVMPLVIDQCPDAVLYIVGKDPTEEVKALSNEHIVVTGTVESVKEYYTNAVVATLPIFSGGGVKTKLIEAVSYGVPIVSTSFGVLGTIFRRDEDIIVADKEAAFAEGIVYCIKYHEICDKMVKKAYEKFESNYTWNGICSNLMKKLSDL